MKEPRSRKAIYVRKEAPSFCHIWFICKENLVHTRESKPSIVSIGAEYQHIKASPYAEEAVWPLRSSSVAEGGGAKMKSAMRHRRVESDNHGMQHRLPFSGSPGVQSPPSHSSSVDSLMRTPSIGSRISTSSSERLDRSSVTPLKHEVNEIGSESESLIFQLSPKDYSHSSASARTIVEKNTRDELYDRLDQFVAEAESSRKEAYDESIRRKKAEREVIDIIRRLKESETICAEELRRRRETEEALERTRQETAEIKWQLNKVLDDFSAVEEQRTMLQHRLADADRIVNELKQKTFSSVDLLQKCEEERNELEVERDAALRVAEKLREKLGEELFFSEFSVMEIEEATNNFDESYKIGEGGYGGIYIGRLRHTQVAIKVLHPDSLQGPVEFQQEVNILSRLRHPNIVNLIGACPEAWALVYEYLPNGSLEDHLICKNNTPPLPWKTRVRIAAELCSALIFLHSCRPQGVIHGDLKPSNILLDANFVCKLGDFGICRQLPRNESWENNITLFWKTERPRGTIAYIDPEFLATGELTVKSDVYSFGIILLRLLTGRPAMRIVKEVRSALEKGSLKEVLDPTAGAWPLVQAQQLTHLGLSCSDLNRRNRPDLGSQVWRVIEAMNMNISCRYEEHGRIPPYFTCPIFQEVMQDPVVAADGYTYESEALKGWLESGHDTSPVTNLKLLHFNMVPNHHLRSAIQQWLQTPQN
ncbi:U-box domain-containing protein 33-like isoform X2 [Andrographis paniculata]|nr:U-box domain-containing protein 33-like isoform X2 [Andrographis paniculata]